MTLAPTNKDPSFRRSAIARRISPKISCALQSSKIRGQPRTGDHHALLELLPVSEKTNLKLRDTKLSRGYRNSNRTQTTTPPPQSRFSYILHPIYVFFSKTCVDCRISEIIQQHHRADGHTVLQPGMRRRPCCRSIMPPLSASSLSSSSSRKSSSSLSM